MRKIFFQNSCITFAIAVARNHCDAVVLVKGGCSHVFREDPRHSLRSGRGRPASCWGTPSEYNYICIIIFCRFFEPAAMIRMTLTAS